MSAAEVIKVLKASPFEPFVIRVSDETKYEVRHPDQVIVTPRSLHVGIQSNGNPHEAQDVAICSLMHITRLVPARRRIKRRR